MRPEEISPLSMLRSDVEIADFIGKVQIDGFRLDSLDEGSLGLDANPDAKAHRAEMITAVRGGKHMELSVTALTFRQRPKANRRYLRLAADKLADRAPTWKGAPLLVDHTTWSMKASMGTILSSKLVQESANVAAFEQVLHAVKPDAVIGFLDGTFKKFSIGWFALGPVTCSVHGCDVTSKDSCMCWPGETVTVDGEPKVVQYEFSDYEGKETSVVVVPAVKDTSVEDIRAALAAELQLPRRQRTPEMSFKRLAAVLKLTALATEADEGAAVTAVEGLSERALQAEMSLRTVTTERDTLQADNAALKAKVALLEGSALDALITDAYKSGRLIYGKDAEGKNTPDALESLLRDHGIAKGAKALGDKLAAMQPRALLGQRSAETTTEPAKATLQAVPSDAELAAMAARVGVPLNELRAQYGLAPIGGAA